MIFLSIETKISLFNFEMLILNKTRLSYVYHKGMKSGHLDYILDIHISSKRVNANL